MALLALLLLLLLLRLLANQVPWVREFFVWSMAGQSNLTGFIFFLPGGPHGRPRPTRGRKAGAAAEGRTNAAAALHHPSLL